MTADLMFRPVAELARLVRDGELTATELVTESLQRIEEHQPSVNAFTHVDADGALAAAAKIGAGDERPFAGVPIAIKDNRPVAGMPLTFCAQAMGDFVAPGDASLVRRLREAGFVIVGKTALPEFGIMPVSESTLSGPVRNPWNLERTPGGSSGGSAAAVAAGMVPIAHANDGAGSTRIPAACCGLVGLKTQRGRISVGPAEGDSLLVTDGVLTRSVAETAQLLDVLAGYETGDATWAPPPAEPFATAAAREPRALRIGFTVEPALEDVEPDPSCVAAAREAASLLGSLGHEIVEVTAPWRLPGALELVGASFGPLVAVQVAFAQSIAGRALTAQDMEPLSWMIWQQAQGLSSVSYLFTLAQLNAFARGFIAFCESYDAILTPALAAPPVRIGELDPRAPDPAETFLRGARFTPYLATANITGQPAISLPLAEGDDGLPRAIQLIGRPATEGALLALAAQIERARPWAGRRAPVAASAP